MGKKDEPVSAQLKHHVSKTKLRSKVGKLKALNKRKLLTAALKLKIRCGIKSKRLNARKHPRKVSSSEQDNKSTFSPLQYVNLTGNDVLKEKIHKKHLSKLSKLQAWKKVVDYQNALEDSCQDENVAQLWDDGSFENNFQHHLKSDLSSKEIVGNETKSSYKNHSNIACESVSSMFKRGFKNKDIIKTPNIKSNILQHTDNDTYKSISECRADGDLCSDAEYSEGSYKTEAFRSASSSTQNILHYNEPEVGEVDGGITPIVKFYSVSKNSYVIVLKHPSTFFIEGELKIRVLNGALKVLGHVLTNASGEKSCVYSPAGYCKLSFQTVDTGASPALTHTKAVLLSNGLSTQKVQDIIANLNLNDCVALIERASSSLATYLESHCSICLYPRCIGTSGPSNARQFYEQEKTLHCLFDFDGKSLTNHLVEPTEWDRIVDCIGDSLENDCARVMICGGKSVGKSTLLRFLINKSLSRVKEVLCLDFDPGQTEFTVPGSVSVVRVSKPLLGPNFTHMLQTERMVYIGDVDMSKCPGQYIRSVQHIVEYCESQPDFKKMLWFINTMGFNKGVGVDLTTNLIKLINPTDVVQIHSKLRQRNFPDLLSPENVMNRKSALQSLLADVQQHVNYTLHIIPSAAEEVHEEAISEGGMPPKQSRNIMVLAYFHSMLKSPRFSLLDIIPYKIPLSQLILGICHETVDFSELLCVMNANLVALCCVLNDEHVLLPEDNEFPKVLTQPHGAHCLGFGVVRGIDINEKLLYLITPLPEEQLRNVNCLLSGSITLPTNLYMNSNTVLGHVPYVTLGSGQATSNRKTRRIIPPIKQQSPHGVRMKSHPFPMSGGKIITKPTKKSTSRYL